MMTWSALLVDAQADSLVDRLGFSTRGWGRMIRRRMRERRFWAIQLGVALVMGLHCLIEWTGLAENHAGILGSLPHLVVALYLVPVVYAGLAYGAEGGVLTGLWTGLLTIPNMLLWHRTVAEFVAELIYVTFVLVLGALISLPVEREKEQRAAAEAASRRAETTSRRLAFLNEVASLLARTSELRAALQLTLKRLGEVLDLEASAVARTSEASGEPVVEAADSRSFEGLHAIRDAAREAMTRELTPHEVVGIPFDASTPGRGIVVVRPTRTLEPGEREMLTAVTAQIGVALDNVRMQRLEQTRLESYLAEMTRAQEEERQHIARDLHDVATHELLLLCRGLDEICERPTTPPLVTGRLTELRTRAGGIVDYLRRCSRDLRPTVLDHLGLAPALEWLVEDVRTRIDATLQASVVGRTRRLAEETELALFRIAQEALRNVERHAAASHVEVTLTYVTQRVTLTVRDDGTGFDARDSLDRLAQRGSLGLLGMRERAQLVGATFTIASAPGDGATITVDVLLPETRT